MAKKSVRDRRIERQAMQRQNYADRTIDRLERGANNRSATVEGYDADSGKVRLRLAGATRGSEILADSLSNGSIERGTQVVTQRARGSNSVAIDAMPR